MLSVVFYARCFWAQDTALNCRRQITLDQEDSLELGKEEPSQAFILDSHKHTLKHTHRYGPQRRASVALSVSVLWSSHPVLTLLVVIIVRSVAHCNTTTLRLFLERLQHNQGGLHHPLTHKPAHTATHSVRLAQVSIKLHSNIRTDGTNRGEVGEVKVKQQGRK